MFDSEYCARPANPPDLTGQTLGDVKHSPRPLKSTEPSPRTGLFSLKPVGADEKNRTSDLLITNQLLYQLSYISTSL